MTGGWRTHSRTLVGFLQLTDADSCVLREHADMLLDRSEEFARRFYEYLQKFPETSAVLDRYKASRGSLDLLVASQVMHLQDLLLEDFDSSSYARLIELGSIHYRHGVEPIWVLGSYLLFQNHLYDRVQSAPELDSPTRDRLLRAITKVLFRDSGVMIEGYWLSAQRDLAETTDQVASVRQQVKDLLNSIPLILWSVSLPDQKVLFVSPHGMDLLPEGDHLPIPCGDRILPQYRPTVLDAWERCRQGETVSLEVEVLDLRAPRRWLRYTFFPHPVGFAKAKRIDGVMEDLTEVKTLGVRLLETESTDRLTGLPNRTLALDRLEQAIQIGQRRRDREVVEVVLILLDLDQFAHVNENFGYHVGDALLTQVTERILSVLRSSDTLARVGADEFAIILPDASNGMEEATRIVSNVGECFQRTFRCQGQEVFIRPSIGVAIWPFAGHSALDLFTRAEVALATSKKQELKPQFHQTGPSQQRGRVLEVTTELHHALDRGELLLHYQPIIDIGTASVVSVEALMRWNHPRFGLLAPGEFLGIAERSGLIRPLTEWAIASALRQCMEWRRGGNRFRVSCNLSPRCLHDMRTVDMIRHSLLEAGSDSDLLELEITEETLISTPERIRGVLQDLTALGAVVAIDDFGTGYSSLSYLRTLPVNTLKLDKSIVRDIVTDDAAAAIVASTVDLAHTLGYTVVAEGVESVNVLDKLRELGCERAQGYYLAQPMSVLNLTQWLEQPTYTSPPAPEPWVRP